MSRVANIRYDVEKMDADIREIDGERYSKAHISAIMRKGSTYYNGCMAKGTISEDAISKVCRFYKLKKKDYIIHEPPKVEEPEVVENPVDAVDAISPETPLAIMKENIDPVVLDPNASKLTSDNFEQITNVLIAQNKALQDQIAQQKSTNYLLEQIVDRLIKIKNQDESILKLLQERERKFDNKRNMKRIG